MVETATVSIQDKTWQVEVAVSAAELAQGLGGRVSLDPLHGMLFDLGSDRITTVTAESMLFPLDVVFVNSSLAVTEVRLNLEPGGEITSTIPARLFLEVNAGEGIGIEPGDSVVISGYTPPAPSSMVSIIGAVIPVMIIMAFMGMMVKGMK